MRQMLFISHANPEDNEFTRWLALQLAREGYAAWCDLTKLLGGETFWRDIESAIRQRTAKFLYVLSRTSNIKDGPLNELNVALSVARDAKLSDFIIPLHIDDLPHREVNIQISRLNAVEFRQGWADGLRQLVKKLQQDEVPKDPRFNPSAVASWWRENRDYGSIVSEEPEEHLSNWFPIKALPPTTYMHLLKHGLGAKRDDDFDTSYPSQRIGGRLVSFAPATDLKIHVDGTTRVSTTELCERDLHGVPFDAREGRHCVIRLLRLAWTHFVQERGLPTYSLSNKRACAYFTHEKVASPRVSFTLPNGFKGSRSLTGKNRKWSSALQSKVDRYWHFAVSADVHLYPMPVFAVKSHVLFSSDGKNIWDGKAKLHSARRSHCKDWWNPHWRDRLFASMFWLSGHENALAIPVSSDTAIVVGMQPIAFNSPVRYDDSLALSAGEISDDHHADDEDNAEGDA
jgi:hypothetical protein